MGRSRKWTAAEDALLGKLPDAEIARRICTGTHNVVNRRKKLGIPPAKRQLPIAPKPLRAPLADIMDGKRIKDLTADEYLAAAQMISRRKRFGR